MVDIHIFVNGPSHLLPQLRVVLEGKEKDLTGLTVIQVQTQMCTFDYSQFIYFVPQFGPFDKYGKESLDKDNVTEIDSDVTEIDSDVTEIDSDVTEIDSDVTEIDGDMTEIDSDVTEADGDMTETGCNTKTVNVKTEDWTQRDITIDDIWDAIFPPTPP